MKSRFLVMALCFAISLLLIGVETKPVQANDIYACKNMNTEFYVIEETIKTDAPGKFSCHVKNVKNGKTYAISVWSYHQENGEWFCTVYYDGIPKGGPRPLSSNWISERIFDVIISYI